jgi:hypothetical protein
MRQLELSVDKRERALADKRKKIRSLAKRQAALLTKRDKFATEPGKKRTKRYLKALSTLRSVGTELDFCRNWVLQKERVLKDKQGRLERQRADLAADHLRLCFGSRKLLAQRPSERNADTTPFADLADWQAAWAEAREGQWWSIGHTDKPGGNAEVQWDSETLQLRIRLTDKVAHRLMDERGCRERAHSKSSCRCACSAVS